MGESVDKPVRLGTWRTGNSTQRRVRERDGETAAANRELQYQRDQLAAARCSLRWLEEFAPDVVGLQELKCTDEAFPREAIEALGYAASGTGRRAGTASRC